MRTDSIAVLCPTHKPNVSLSVCHIMLFVAKAKHSWRPSPQTCLPLLLGHHKVFTAQIDNPCNMLLVCPGVFSQLELAGLPPRGASREHPKQRLQPPQQEVHSNMLLVVWSTCPTSEDEPRQHVNETLFASF